MPYSLAAELFSELAFGIIIFAVRFYARWKYVEFNSWGLDDVFAGIAIIFWVLESTFLFTCVYFGNNIGLDAQTALDVPDADLPDIIKGSKHAFVAWLFYILLVWTLKGVLLLLYNRLTMGLWQHKLAKVMIVFSMATFIASLFWHIFSCFPVHRAWQVKPYPGDECTLRKGNYIIICVLDVATDLGIMAVPLPMLFQANLSLRRKLTLGFLFTSGIFVIICAILRAYYSLLNIDSLMVALGWASREVLVGTIVVCSPTIKPLISEVKRSLADRSWNGSCWKSRGGSNHGMSKLTDHSAPHPDPENVPTVAHGGPKRTPTYKMTVMSRAHPNSESQDHINATPDGDCNSTNSNGTNSNRGNGNGNGIIVKTEFEVTRQ